MYKYLLFSMKYSHTNPHINIKKIDCYKLGRYYETLELGSESYINITRRYCKRFKKISKFMWFVLLLLFMLVVLLIMNLVHSSEWKIHVPITVLDHVKFYSFRIFPLIILACKYIHINMFVYFKML